MMMMHPKQLKTLYLLLKKGFTTDLHFTESFQILWYRAAAQMAPDEADRATQSTASWTAINSTTNEVRSRSHTRDAIPADHNFSSAITATTRLISTAITPYLERLLKTL